MFLGGNSQGWRPLERNSTITWFHCTKRLLFINIPSLAFPRFGGIPWLLIIPVALGIGLALLIQAGNPWSLWADKVSRFFVDFFLLELNGFQVLPQGSLTILVLFYMQVTVKKLTFHQLSIYLVHWTRPPLEASLGISLFDIALTVDALDDIAFRQLSSCYQRHRQSACTLSGQTIRCGDGTADFLCLVFSFNKQTMILQNLQNCCQQFFCVNSSITGWIRVTPSESKGNESNKKYGESAPKWPGMSGIWMLETSRSLGISTCVNLYCLPVEFLCQEKLARGEPIEDSGYGYWGFAYGPCWKSNVVTNGQQLIREKKRGTKSVQQCSDKSWKLFGETFLLVEQAVVHAKRKWLVTSCLQKKYLCF